MSGAAAQEAANTAAFNEKKWVWVVDDKEGYLAGYVEYEDETSARVRLGSGMVRPPLCSPCCFGCYLLSMGYWWCRLGQRLWSTYGR